MATNLILNPTLSARKKDAIIREFSEYSIKPSDVEGFSKWLLDNFDSSGPDAFFNEELLNTEYGYIFQRALNRYNNQTIQRPTAADKPRASRGSIGGLIYAITTFSYAFHGNLVIGELKRVAYQYKANGLGVGAQSAAILTGAYGALVLATMVFQAIRLALFDDEEWEKRYKDGTLLGFLFARSLSMVNPLGPPADLLINIASGIKYQRDPATVLVGPYLAAQFTNASNQIALGANNGPNNTAEYNAIKSMWKTTVSPVIIGGLSWVPGGKIVSGAATAGIVGVGSSTVADNVAESFVGKKGSGNAKKSEPKEPKEPGEPKEAAE